MAKKKAKKRGVKPGTKRGKYNKTTGDIKVSSPYDPSEMLKAIGVLTLCGQLESTIDALAARLTSINARLNSLM